jgi:predicted amino acid racemase
MVVFVEDADIDHIPQVILTEASEQEGRVKLILLKINFQDDFDTLYIKYNEIDPVIKHINVI